MQVLSDVTDNLCVTNMTTNDMLEAVSYAMQLVGVEPEGLQMPANDAMTPITYAGMSTRQVDFEKCRQLIKEFLDNSFVVVDE